MQTIRFPDELQTFITRESVFLNEYGKRAISIQDFVYNNDLLWRHKGVREHIQATLSFKIACLLYYIAEPNQLYEHEIAIWDIQSKIIEYLFKVIHQFDTMQINYNIMSSKIPNKPRVLKQIPEVVDTMYRTMHYRFVYLDGPTEKISKYLSTLTLNKQVGFAANAKDIPIYDSKYAEVFKSHVKYLYSNEFEQLFGSYFGEQDGLVCILLERFANTAVQIYEAFKNKEHYNLFVIQTSRAALEICHIHSPYKLAAKYVESIKYDSTANKYAKAMFLCSEHFDNSFVKILFDSRPKMCIEQMENSVIVMDEYENYLVDNYYKIFLSLINANVYFE